jgi:hypothetical protein
MGFQRIFAATLLALGFAASASAGVQMYSGEIIMHTRGSDAAGNFVAIPFGQHCNTRPYHAGHTEMFTLTKGTFTLTIPKFGGQIPVIDTNTDMIPDVAAGCAPASLQVGLPLTGGGALSTTGTASTSRTAFNPRGFSIPASDLARMTSGASFLETTWLPLTFGSPRFQFEIEYADLRNAAGGFADGAGPGSFTITHGAKTNARVHVKAGKNQYGGTMRLLGEYHTNRGLYATGGPDASVGATPWNLQYIGAGAATNAGVVTGGLQYTAMISRSYRFPGVFDYSPRSVTISAFPWTTGTVEVTATGGPQSTMLQRVGYDNRTPAGGGNIQMLSPALTRWKNASSDYFTGGIATLKLSFVPEPSAWLMLVTGSCAIALLHRVARRRGSA